MISTATPGRLLAWLIRIVVGTVVGVALPTRWMRESASQVLSLKRPSPPDAKFTQRLDELTRESTGPADDQRATKALAWLTQ